MASICGSYSCQDCANAKSEWNKIELAKKRLELEKEALALDQELLKAERKKLKVRNKLETKKERAESLQQQQPQDGDAELSLQNKLDELSLEHRQELDECKAQLSATQKSLAELFVEKDLATKERDRLAQQSKDQSCVTCEGRNEEVETLERELQQMKHVYASSLATHATEKRKWEEQGSQLTSNLTSADVDSEKFEKLRNENRLLTEQLQKLKEELESRKIASQQQVDLAESHQRTLKEKEEKWDGEKELLQRQIEEQTSKLDDWKLLIQRNKLLLEKEQLKNEELEQELEEVTQKQTHTEVAFDDYQRAADGIRKDLETEMRKKDKLQMENERLLRERDELNEARERLQQTLDNQMQSGGSAFSNGGSGGQVRLSATIPSDLVSSGGGEFRGMHVTELDWEGKDLSGKFTGWLDPEGNPDGHGTLRMEDESVYDGEWKFGEWNGYGVYTTADGDLYSGTWKEGKQENRGVYVWSDGCIYTGDYVEGSRDGKGIMTWPYGAKYEGEFQFDRRNGRGIYNYPDGRTYNGEYREDRRHGVGTETDAEGNVLYKGRWVMGEFQAE